MPASSEPNRATARTLPVWRNPPGFRRHRFSFTGPRRPASSIQLVRSQPARTQARRVSQTATDGCRGTGQALPHCLRYHRRRQRARPRRAPFASTPTPPPPTANEPSISCHTTVDQPDGAITRIGSLPSVGAIWVTRRGPVRYSCVRGRCATGGRATSGCGSRPGWCPEPVIDTGRLRPAAALDGAVASSGRCPARVPG